MSSTPPPRGTRARAERQGGATPTRAKPPGTPVTPRSGSASTAVPNSTSGSGSRRSGSVAAADADPRSTAVVERELGPDELAALEEQRAFLLTSLRDLEAEHDVGDVDDHDYEQLKDDYTARAAAVIRAIDDHHRVVAARRPTVSWSRRLLAIGAVALVALLAGVLVARSAGQRDAGDTITGGIRQSTRDDLLSARQNFGNGDYDAAIAVYDSVLADDPANLEAVTYRGWMYRLKATTEVSSDPVPSLKAAITDLKSALAIAPTDGTALTFLAVLYGDLGRPADALATLDQVPPDGVPSFMAPTVEQFRQEMLDLQSSQSGSSGSAGSSTTTAS